MSFENARIDFDGSIIEFKQINIEIKIPSTPNFPDLVPTRYVVELPENIYVDETHAFDITGFTRKLTFPLSTNEYYIDPITPVNPDPAMPFLIEFHSSNAGQVKQVQFYGVGSSLTKAIIGGSVPIGGSVLWFTETAPTGFVFADGSLLNKDNYSKLFQIYGFRYGGDGNYFALPNLCGRVPRGWDNGQGVDPDAGSRTSPFTSFILTGNTTNGSPIITNIDTTKLFVGEKISGTGIPTETEILSIDSASQLTMNKNATATGSGVSLTFELIGDHVGTLQNDKVVNHTHNTTIGAHSHTVNNLYTREMGGSIRTCNSVDDTNTTLHSTNSYDYGTKTSTNPNSSLGGNESRMKNFNVMYCIRYE